MTDLMTITERLTWLLNTPEGQMEMQSISAKFVTEIEAKELELLEYYNTDFSSDFDILQKHIEAGNDVHCQSLLYETDEFHKQISEKTFWQLYKVCTEHDGAIEIEDENAMFSTYGFIHKGIVFETMSGQGTILRAYSANGGTTYPLKDTK